MSSLLARNNSAAATANAKREVGDSVGATSLVKPVKHVGVGPNLKRQNLQTMVILAG